MRPGRKYPVLQPHHCAGKNPAAPGFAQETTAMRDQLATIDEYIASFPPDIQEKLQGIRAVIRKAAPDAEEAITVRDPDIPAGRE